MAHRSRVLKRKPRDWNLALSPCMSYKPGEDPQEFKPAPKANRKLGVTTLPNGKLIVKTSDL